jgi:hypothetical protein
LKHQAKAPSAGSTQGTGNSRALLRRAFVTRAASGGSSGSGARAGRRIRGLVVTLALALCALALTAAPAFAAATSASVDTITAVSYGSAHITATIHADGGQPNTVGQTYWRFDYSSDEGQTWVEGPDPAHAGPIPINGDQTVEADFIGLKSGTKYLVRVGYYNETTNEAGTSLAPNPDFTTLAADPPVVETTDNAAEVGYTTAEVSGKINRPAASDDLACNFEYVTDQQFIENEGNSLPLFEGATSVACDQSPVATVGSSTVSTKLTGLATGTIYHLRLTASGAGGSDSKVAASTFVTESPTAPTLAIDPPSEVKYTTAHISGSVDPEGGNEEGGNPLPIRWELQYSPDPVAFGWSFAAEGTIEGPEAGESNPIPVSANLEFLQSAREYKFRLVASYAGNVVNSPEGTFETQTASAPTVVIDPASSVTAATAHFSGHVTAGGTDPAFNSTCSFEYITDAAFQPHGEIQRLTIRATEGTFTLSYEGEVTGPLPFNASDAEIETALQGLAKIGSGGVIVSPGPSGPKVIVSHTLTFPAATNINEVGADPTFLTSNQPEVSFNEFAEITTITQGHPEGFEAASSIACAPLDPQTGTINGESATAVHADATGLEPNAVYHLRLRAKNQGGESSDVAANFETDPIAPGVQTLSASQSGAHSAVLAGRVNAHNSAVTYQFQWGMDATYGNFAPASPAPLGASDNSSHLVAAPITGLQEGVTYHFRIVATNTETNEASAGADHVFEAPLAPGSSACPNEQRRSEANSLALPECRAYELTMPAVKDFPFGAANRPLAFSSSDGNAVAYNTYGPMPGARSGMQEDFNVARRGEGGWTNTPISPPQSNDLSLLSLPTTFVFTEDLKYAGLYANPPLANAPEGVSSLFVGNTETNTYTYLGAQSSGSFANGNVLNAFVVALSADGSHAVYTVQVSGASNTYEYFNGTVRNVGIYPDGTVAERSFIIEGAGYPVRNALSRDGRRIVWSDGSQLFDRIDGTETVELSASHRTVPDPHGRGLAHFRGASVDGGKVFFTTRGALTDTATPGGTEDLYEYDLESATLTDLTAAAHGTANVLGVVGNSDDGEYVYFVATGDLGGGAEAGADNLYLAHAGAITYIASLDPADSPAWGFPGLLFSTARVSADGYLAIQSVARLTGYDNVSSSTGAPTNQVYLYSPGPGTLICASCRPDGSPPSGSATIRVANLLTNTHRNLSDDGTRLFFDSTDAIVPGDTNGKTDVYEWTAGAPDLISDGTGDFDSTFQDASPSGNDMFFATGARLVGQDTDSHIDLYDARVGGGFPRPAAAPVPCEGEACRGSGSAVAGVASAATPGFSGPGNPHEKATNGKKRAKALKACRSNKHSKKQRRKCESKVKKRFANKSGRGK